jgi:hypothetical protein
MLISGDKPTGTTYTPTAALLIVAFVFIPAVLIVSRPFSYASLLAGIVCSAISVGFAMMSWIKFSRLSISSIAGSGTSTK